MLFATAGPAVASDPFTPVAEQVAPKLVKLFGAGGFRGVVSYGVGVTVSPDGHVLTAASLMLDTSDLVAHLWDGRRMKAVVVAAEPLLDVALLKIVVPGKPAGEPTGLNLPHFDLAEAAKRPPASPGDWVLGFGNMFEIAMRDEPVTVQRGVIAAVTKLTGRRGVFDFPYTGEAYLIDAITNNPGAAGGALTDLKGNLLGLIGRELKNTLSETWVNYAIPVNATVTVTEGGKPVTVSVPKFVEAAVAGKYKPVRKEATATAGGGYHGIVFVPNVLARTPPFVEDLRPNSPAAKAGLRADDLISFVDGEPVPSVSAFQALIRRATPGQTLRLEVRRGGGLHTVELTLAEPPKAKK
ncbi:MAG: trypsin-like peptidase domain-containing protein [Gemmataceae bacterium]